MNLRKVYGGTPVGTESRCDTCEYSLIVRGYAESERINICDYLSMHIHIPFKVSECSAYADKRLPCIEDLEEIAWQLRSKSAGVKAGFVNVGAQSETEEQNNQDACPQIAAGVRKS